jgi:hypothetical protein
MRMVSRGFCRSSKRSACLTQSTPQFRFWHDSDRPRHFFKHQSSITSTSLYVAWTRSWLQRRG